MLRRVDSDGALYTSAGDGTTGFPVEGEPALAASLSGISGVTQASDGDLFLLVSGIIYQVGLTLDGYLENEILVPSAGGGEVYVFDADGRHLRTLHGLTGTTLYTFGYDSAGRLTTMTDADDLVTEVMRDDDGDAEAIVGPFSQTTTLTMDSNGYLGSVSNPAGETHGFEYVAGLMTRFEDPRVLDEGYTEAKVYQYDGKGRLVRDDDALNGSTGFRRQGEVGQPDYEVRHRTSVLVTERNRVRRSRTGEQVREKEAADGTIMKTRTSRDGLSVTTMPDGSELRQEQRPDPRFGLLAGFGGAGALERPGGQLGETVATRTVTLGDAADPFSVTSLSHTSSIEGRQTTLSYDGVMRRFTATSPEARARTLDIDERGRLIAATSPQVEPLAVAYRPSGEVDAVTLGTDPLTQRLTDFGYDELHRLETVTDPENLTVTYGYDAANRISTLTLPDTQVVGLGYDAMGSVTSVTPPGRPAHVFTYTKRNQLETYALPDAGSGVAVETRFYDADRRLESIGRPDGLDIVFTYEFRKDRLEKVTTPRGDLSFTYQADGKLETVTTFDGEGLEYDYDGPAIDSTTWTGQISGAIWGS